MTDDEEFKLELKKVFFEELDDTLEQLESSFLVLEREPEDKSGIHSVFRLFHNIKGSAKTIGLNPLASFSHIVENLLARARNDEVKLNAKIIDCFLESLDLIKSYTSDLQNGHDDPSQLIEQATKIEQYCQEASDGASATSSDESSSSEEDVAPAESIPVEEVEKPISSGFELFSDDAEEPAPTESAPEQVLEKEVVEQSIQASSEMEPEASKPEKVPVVAKKTASVESDEQIKVSTRKINEILDLFGEQVILQSGLDHALEQPTLDLNYINRSAAQMRKITRDLQHTMVTLRMVPLDNLFNRMERAVRDVAKSTGKKISFEKIGQSSEIDKAIADALVDPLTHMVRNAADHGIEPEETRKEAGKPEFGKVSMRAQRLGGVFEIVIEDDGKGLDKDVILAKAKAKGLVKPGAKLADTQIFDLIFASGFSTLEKASEISGRGVGMDVVKQKIKSLKGTCEISSILGRGSRFTIKVPLSLAMFNGTVVSVNDQRYVIPNSDFSEALKIREKNPDGPAGVMRIGDRMLRSIDLKSCLTYRNMGAGQKKDAAKIPPADDDLAIVAWYEDHEYALLVNSIISQEQIVLKDIGPQGKQIRGTSGGTILGDGKVALVLDISAIIKREHIKIETK